MTLFTTKLQAAYNIIIHNSLSLPFIRALGRTIVKYTFNAADHFYFGGGDLREISKYMYMLRLRYNGQNITAIQTKYKRNNK